MISFTKVDFTAVAPNTDPAIQEGITSLVQASAAWVKTGSGGGSGDIVISKGGGSVKTPKSTAAVGLAAPQPIGMIPLRACPLDDCRDNGECFMMNVFGGSTKAADNDYSTFMLEYPFTGNPPYFSDNLSKWTLRKSIAGVMTLQESIGVTSNTCTIKNYVKGNYIYYHITVWWDKVLASYGEGIYDIYVESTIDGSKAAQCTDKFNLNTQCCDPQFPALPIGNCAYGVTNGELITPAVQANGSISLFGWTMFASDVGPNPMYWYTDDALFVYFTDLKVNHHTIFNAATCSPMVPTTSYTVTYEIVLDPGTYFKVTLGTASGAVRTQSGVYTEVITCTGTTLEVEFGTIATIPGGFNPGLTYVAQLKYLRIPALSGATIENINLQNNTFAALGQTFEALNPMYQIPGWTDTNGTYLSFSQSALHWENYHPGYNGKLAVGHRTPIPMGYVGFLKANATNPILNNGDTYAVTIKIDACDPEIQISVMLGGNMGPTHNAAGTYQDSIVCGADGTGLIIVAEMIATSTNSRPAFINYVEIIKTAGSGGKGEPAPCHELANCTMQVKVSNGKSIFKYPNGERFDYRGKWVVNDMGIISTVTDPLFTDCVRLPGIFGYGESGEEKIDIRYNSGLVKNIRQEIIRRYTMKTDMLPYDLLERIEVFGRFAEEMLVSDFNVINPDYSLSERSVKIDGDFKPDYDTSHQGRTRLLMLEMAFVDRVRDIERRIC